MPASSVIPVLSYPDVPSAATWLCSAFGFAERLRIGSYRIQLSVGGGAIVVSSGDGHFKRASNAGTRTLSEPTSQPFGERQYSAKDPWKAIRSSQNSVSTAFTKGSS